PAACRLDFPQQRRLFRRRPPPPALNHDLAIHPKHSFWTIQKDSASLNALPSNTRNRPVQTGRLLAGHMARYSCLRYERTVDTGPGGLPGDNFRTAPTKWWGLHDTEISRGLIPRNG